MARGHGRGGGHARHRKKKEKKESRRERLKRVLAVMAQALESGGRYFVETRGGHRARRSGRKRCRGR